MNNREVRADGLPIGAFFLKDKIGEDTKSLWMRVDGGKLSEKYTGAVMITDGGYSVPQACTGWMVTPVEIEEIVVKAT